MATGLRLGHVRAHAGAAPAVPAELSFDLPVRDVTVWRPSASERPVLRRATAKRLSFDVGADVVLVSMR